MLAAMTCTPAQAWGWRGCWPRSRLSARVRLLFQPAEELAQAGVDADAGAVEGLDALYGLHVVPNLPVGTVESGGVSPRRPASWRSGAGEGGHGARPSGCGCCLARGSGDAELRQTISRRLDALQPVVISFGKLEAVAPST